MKGIVNPKISVIIPVYGAEKYIERCVRSLFEQSLHPIEYIFIDDCTMDRSIDIICQLLNDYPERKEWVRVIKNKENSGQAFSRMVGMKAATGKYVIQCDSDDWVAPDMYELLYNHAEENNLDMVWCDYYRTDGLNHKHISQMSSVDRLSIISDFLTGRLLASLCNRLYRRELHMAEDFVFPTANMTEDFVISLQITLSSQRIGYIPTPLYYYYVNPNSICVSPSETRIISNLKDTVQNTEIVLSLLQKNGLVGTFQKQIVCKKFLTKETLIGLLSQSKYRELWINTYKEVNKKILFNKYIPSKSKVRFFCVRCNFYWLLSFLTKEKR